jgi:hypothetical protein
MTERVLYQDVIPYEMPSSLAALHGPTEGVITLPLTVYWGPDATADLSTPEVSRRSTRTSSAKAPATSKKPS